MEENEGEKIEFQEGLKPVPGIPSNFGQGTTIFQTDENGNITRINTSGAPLDTRNVKTKEEYENPVRVGDYYYAPNRTIQVWENSPTDIIQKTKVAIGGTEKPADTVSLKNEGLGILGGAAIGSILPGPAGMAGAIIGGIAGGLNAHNTAAEEALKQWQEQDVKYDSAVEFYKDNDGTVKYKIDYQKMGEGGPRSGEWVKEAQNRETEVKLGDDGRLKVKVSPIFASTERFQELMNYISENYGGLNKNTENLDEVLTEIKNGIDGEAQDYVTNMKLYADFAHRFPNASPETVVASYTTEVAGYVDPAKMGDYQVSVLEGDQIGVRSAKEFFDSVLQMDKGKRNEITKRLNDIVYGDTGQFNDDQRAIAYGELQALFVASANTEGYENDPYQGMMDADPFVSFLNNFAPLGLNGSDVVSFLSGGTFSKQEYLNQNDFAEFLGGAAGIGAGFGLWKGGTKLVEGALKRLPGSAQLFNASVSGHGKEAWAFVQKVLKNDPSAAVKAWSAEAAFKTLKVGIFDAALAGAQTAVSGKDFWSEFGQDFARDAILEAIFSYYDMVSYMKGVDDTLVQVYEDPRTGNLVKYSTPSGEQPPEQIILAGTGEPVDETFTSIGLSGKPEEFTRSGNGTSVYTPKGKLNIRTTRTGDVVGVYQDANTTSVYYNGKEVSVKTGEAISPSSLESGDIGIDEFPALNTGVVNTSTSSGTEIITKAIEQGNLSPDIETKMMPSQQANAAIVAGKIAKAQGTKVGLEIYKQLFNKNAVLDMANNLALAKDGDQNAWRHAQEQFVSVAQNAQNNIQDIQNGIYVKEAAPEWQKTLEVMGGFNYEYKYKPKTDGAYINAINQMQRAQLLNDNREEGDTTDYVAKALEVYGPTIDSMPQDRAEALQGWLEQGKKWLKVFNQSVRKSGKVDVKKLDSFTDTDIEETIGYFPVWAKRTSYRGLLDRFNGISQQRNPYKEWLRDGEWVPLKELEDPYTAMTRYMGFMANNMGLNDMIENTVSVLERADLLIDNTPSEATVREAKLNSIKNKDELTKKLDKMVEAKKKEVEEATLTPKQYNDAMTKIYEDSAIEETAEALTLKVSGNEQPDELDVFDRTPSAPVQRLMLDESPENAPGGYSSAKEYYEKEKGMKGDIVYISPDEYLEALLDKNGGPYNNIEEIYERSRERTPQHTGWKDYLDDMRNGNFKPDAGNGKFPIVNLIYNADGYDTQEGIHRTLAARALGVTKMPVFIGYSAQKTPDIVKELLKKRASIVESKPETQSQPQNSSEQQWDEFWKNAPAKTRKDIRNELEKTSFQTGYGISDTRARLNAMVPGFDVIDWSLLGRRYTNGLVYGGLYSGMDDDVVKAYIMTTNDLKKLLNLHGEVPSNIMSEAQYKLLHHINTVGGNAPIPLKIKTDRDGNIQIRFDPRGGNSMGDLVPDERHLHAYLESLEEEGIANVPVVVVDTRGTDFNSVFYQVRESGIAQKGLENVVEALDKADATGKTPEFTARDISAALHVTGWTRDRLFRRIRSSIPATSEPGVASLSDMEIKNLFAEADEYDWANDAELKELANSTENIIGEKLNIPPKDITAEIRQAFSEHGRIPFYHNQHSPLGSMEYNDTSGARPAYDGAGDAYWLAPNSSYTDTYGENKLAGTIPIKSFMSDKEKNDILDRLFEEKKKLDAEDKALADERFHAIRDDVMALMDHLHPGEDWQHDTFQLDEYQGFLDQALMGSKIEVEGFVVDPSKYKRKELPKKKAERRAQLQSILGNPKSYGQGRVKSYRALAEYAKKPVIDISEDGFAGGTAFFYYKGVDPKFDEEIGKQLETQARGTQVWPEGLAEEMFDEWTRENTLGDFLNLIKEEAPESTNDVDVLLNKLKDGTIKGGTATKESNLIHKISQQIEKKHPELSHLTFVLSNRVWTVPKEYNLSTPLAEIGIDRSRFYAPHSVENFLEEIGEENPDYVTPEEKAAWEAIDPQNFANVPTNPQFKQPRIPTYEDYQKGLLADPNMARRVQDSYRGALAQKLVKEASRVVGLATDYLKPYAWDSDWESYLNTSLIPDLRDAVNQNMLPEEFQNFVQARMVQAIQDVAPYQSPELILQSQLENVAQEWHDWAVKHIKSGRVTQKELKDFVNSHNLELPNDKRPYPSKVKHALWQMVENGKKLPKIEGFKKPVLRRNTDGSTYTQESKEAFYKALDETPLFRSTIKDKNELVDLVALENNQETTDAYTMGVSATALGLGSRYPITMYKNGQPYTRFIKADTKEHKYWAEQTTALFNDKELVKEEGLISRFFSGAANDFRLLTTGWDPSRTLPNVTRDTSRSFTIGVRFINTKNTLQSAIDAGNYTPKQKAMLKKAIENAAKQAANSSYNSAFRSSKGKQVEITKEYLSNSGANPFKRFMYNLAHDKRSLFEWPMEFFEGYSRRANARSLAAVQLGKDQAAGKSFDEQLKNAVDAANFAGREYTANFQRKGKTIGAVSRYVAYLSSSYAGADGILRAFIDNPKMVARNFAVFVLAYLILLGDTLSREETRKQYYRLSEYDRENQIVIGMGDSILTIPMDQELAGLLFPYRRIMETLEGTDPASFFEFMWGTFTEWMPMDLSGFSEGDGFNLSRGLEKFAAQNIPTGLTPILEAATGYDLYYGNDISVSAETLRDYGIYAPQPGDYTTNGKDSLFLRNVANLTGIPQWQLQAMWEGYGGNVGKYVLNTIDKVAGATKEQQGGKDFFDTVFNSFTALDQDAASSVFYDGLNQLKGEKNSLIQKISDYNEKLKTASGDEKIELQNNIQKAKEEYGTKVADFVNKYVNAYDITGGLPKKQAQQIYYLFRLDDDNTVYESGSPEEYYHNQAKRRFENQATALSAPILDKYYNNRMGNIYQDSDGVWRRYLSGGAQAMRNSIYGYGEEQMVNLLNVLEGKDSNLTSLRTQVKEARNQAYEAGDWDTRDALSYEFDKKVIEAISPYIEKYGAENVLGNTKVLDYLSDWFFVPDDFIRTKKGKYVSLGNNASTQEAFVRPFIKFVFGLPTNFSSYRDAKYNSLEVGK